MTELFIKGPIAGRTPYTDKPAAARPTTFSRPAENDPNWRDKAACRGEDPELFFPIGTAGWAVAQAEEAKAVCRRCDSVDACLSWALETRQDVGIWGGMSEAERRSLKRRSTRQARKSRGAQ